MENLSGPPTSSSTKPEKSNNTPKCFCSYTETDNKATLQYKIQLKEAEMDMCDKDIIIGMLKEHITKLEGLYKRSLDEIQAARFQYCSVVQESNKLKRIFQQIKEENVKLSEEKNDFNNKCQNQVEIQCQQWNKQNKELFNKINGIECAIAELIKLAGNRSSDSDLINKNMSSLSSQMKNLETLLNEYRSILNILKLKLEENREASDENSRNIENKITLTTAAIVSIESKIAKFDFENMNAALQTLSSKEDYVECPARVAARDMKKQEESSEKNQNHYKNFCNNPVDSLKKTSDPGCPRNTSSKCLIEINIFNKTNVPTCFDKSIALNVKPNARTDVACENFRNSLVVNDSQRNDTTANPYNYGSAVPLSTENIDAVSCSCTVELDHNTNVIEGEQVHDLRNLNFYQGEKKLIPEIVLFGQTIQRDETNDSNKQTVSSENEKTQVDLSHNSNSYNVQLTEDNNNTHISRSNNTQLIKDNNSQISTNNHVKLMEDRESQISESNNVKLEEDKKIMISVELSDVNKSDKSDSYTSRDKTSKIESPECTEDIYTHNSGKQSIVEESCLQDLRNQTKLGEINSLIKLVESFLNEVIDLSTINDPTLQSEFSSNSSDGSDDMIVAYCVVDITTSVRYNTDSNDLWKIYEDVKESLHNVVSATGSDHERTKQPELLIDESFLFSSTSLPSFSTNRLRDSCGKENSANNLDLTHFPKCIQERSCKNFSQSNESLIHVNEDLLKVEMDQLKMKIEDLEMKLLQHTSKKV